MAIGKTAPNGTLNADGAFYSVQDVNVLLENAGGGGGGGSANLPTPTVADAGSVVVVDNEGKYALGEAGGGGGFIVTVSAGELADTLVLDKTYTEIKNAMLSGIMPTIIEVLDTSPSGIVLYSIANIMDAAGADPYVVALYNYDSGGSPPIADFPFISDTASGVLTCTLT